MPLTRGHGKKLRKVAQLCLEETSTQELVSALIAGVGGPAHARRSAHTHMCSHLPAHAYTHIHAHILAHTHALSLSLSLSLFGAAGPHQHFLATAARKRRCNERTVSITTGPSRCRFLFVVLLLCGRAIQQAPLHALAVRSVRAMYTRAHPRPLFLLSMSLCLNPNLFSLDLSFSRVFVGSQRPGPHSTRQRRCLRLMQHMKRYGAPSKVVCSASQALGCEQGQQRCALVMHVGLTSFFLSFFLSFFFDLAGSHASLHTAMRVSIV